MSTEHVPSVSHTASTTGNWVETVAQLDNAVKTKYGHSFILLKGAAHSAIRLTGAVVVVGTLFKDAISHFASGVGNLAVGTAVVPFAIGAKIIGKDLSVPYTVSAGFVHLKDTVVNVASVVVVPFEILWNPVNVAEQYTPKQEKNDKPSEDSKKKEEKKSSDHSLNGKPVKKTSNNETQSDKPSKDKNDTVRSARKVPKDVGKNTIDKKIEKKKDEITGTIRNLKALVTQDGDANEDLVQSMADQIKQLQAQMERLKVEGEKAKSSKGKKSGGSGSRKSKKPPVMSIFATATQKIVNDPVQFKQTEALVQQNLSTLLNWDENLIDFTDFNTSPSSDQSKAAIQESSNQASAFTEAEGQTIGMKLHCLEEDSSATVLTLCADNVELLTTVLKSKLRAEDAQKIEEIRKDNVFSAFQKIQKLVEKITKEMEDLKAYTSAIENNSELSKQNERFQGTVFARVQQQQSNSDQGAASVTLEVSYLNTFLGELKKVAEEKGIKPKFNHVIPSIGKRGSNPSPQTQVFHGAFNKISELRKKQNPNSRTYAMRDRGPIDASTAAKQEELMAKITLKSELEKEESDEIVTKFLDTTSYDDLWGVTSDLDELRAEIFLADNEDKLREIADHEPNKKLFELVKKLNNLIK